MSKSRAADPAGECVTVLALADGVSMAAIAAGDSGASALFFDRVGADALPLVYLLQGATTFAVMLALTGVLARIGPRRAYLSAPLGLALLVVIERAVVVAKVEWIYPVLWITVAIATLVQGVFLWGVAGVVVDLRQAKRLFPIFAAGGILGSVLGGLLTGPWRRRSAPRTSCWCGRRSRGRVPARADPARDGASARGRRPRAPTVGGPRRGRRLRVRASFPAARG
jgi:hypothetical protein